MEKNIWKKTPYLETLYITSNMFEIHIKIKRPSTFWFLLYEGCLAKRIREINYKCFTNEDDGSVDRSPILLPFYAVCQQALRHVLWLRNEWEVKNRIKKRHEKEADGQRSTHTNDKPNLAKAWQSNITVHLEYMSTICQLFIPRKWTEHEGIWKPHGFLQKTLWRWWWENYSVWFHFI